MKSSLDPFQENWRELGESCTAVGYSFSKDGGAACTGKVYVVKGTI